ncbi:MAG: DUF5320 domain-containing protein [Anaerolineae bacterium]|jgi:hypothetical protein|nr:DUF5320 domain-containing protein [Anaerolineae bacterium]MBT4309246.1 DUF5320 domain-containing protein [Anaerolineae bacterium]MBT4458523.1 DUF5320 domain-containing protein [Anaerolineae bacterium]MBT4842699.1 DUF5320 domain-containing protein [Anaerolineae bacterium]MBT6062058.1 DUF5320 domain-containing protein [Anaerolineae bacterium]
MPNTDKTGPRGEGAMTGQGMSKCSGNNTENTRGFGRGQGRGGFRSAGGRGRGRGAGAFSQGGGGGVLQSILDTLQSVVGRLDKLEK